MKIVNERDYRIAVEDDGHIFYNIPGDGHGRLECVKCSKVLITCKCRHSSQNKVFTICVSCKSRVINKVIAKLAKKKVEDKLPGGLGDCEPDNRFDPDQIEKGIKIELEHTDDKDLAKEITKDHLTEVPNYYITDKGESRLDVMEEEAEKELEDNM